MISKTSLVGGCRLANTRAPCWQICRATTCIGLLSGVSREENLQFVEIHHLRAAGDVGAPLPDWKRGSEGDFEHLRADNNRKSPLVPPSARSGRALFQTVEIARNEFTGFRHYEFQQTARAFAGIDARHRPKRFVIATGSTKEATAPAGATSAQQNGFWKLQYPRALSGISASKPPPIGEFVNQAQVGFFFTNGVGGVNGAAKIGATLPRGRICGWLTSAVEGAFGDFLVVGFFVAMTHHGRDEPQKQVMDDFHRIKRREFPAL